MRSIKESYQRLIDGGTLTDDECLALMDHFKKLSDLSVETGLMFRLCFLEANNRYMQLRNICISRGLINMAGDRL